MSDTQKALKLLLNGELLTAVFKHTRLLSTLDLPFKGLPSFFLLQVLVLSHLMRCWCVPQYIYAGGRWSESLWLSNSTPWPRMGLVDRLGVSQEAVDAFYRLAGQSLKSEATAGQVARNELGKQDTESWELSQEARGTDERVID